MRTMLFVLVLALPVAADAAPKATCDFIEVSATSAKDPGIDPELKPLEKKLKNPPFSSWNKFHLLSRTEKALEHLKSEQIALKLGRVTGILLDLIPPSKFRLGLTIDDEHGKRTVDNTKVTVEAGDWVILGSSEPNNAGHLLALSCK
jgi:hypothetical protein